MNRNKREYNRATRELYSFPRGKTATKDEGESIQAVRAYRRRRRSVTLWLPAAQMPLTIASLVLKSAVYGTKKSFSVAKYVQRMHGAFRRPALEVKDLDLAIQRTNASLRKQRKETDIDGR